MVGGEYWLFTNYASQCQGQVRDKQGPAGTSRNKQEQTGTKQGQEGTRQGQTEIGMNKQGQSLSVPVQSGPAPGGGARKEPGGRNRGR